MKKLITILLLIHTIILFGQEQTGSYFNTSIMFPGSYWKNKKCLVLGSSISAGGGNTLSTVAYACKQHGMIIYNEALGSSMLRASTKDTNLTGIYKDAAVGSLTQTIQDKRNFISHYERGLNSSGKIEAAGTYGYKDFLYAGAPDTLAVSSRRSCLSSSFEMIIKKYFVPNNGSETLVGTKVGDGYLRYNNGVYGANSNTESYKFDVGCDVDSIFVTTSVPEGGIWACVIFYDVNNNYLGYEGHTSSGSGCITYSNYRIHMPRGTKYIGVTRAGSCTTTMSVKRYYRLPFYGKPELVLIEHGINDIGYDTDSSNAINIPTVVNNRAYPAGAFVFLVDTLKSCNPKMPIAILGHYENKYRTRIYQLQQNVAAYLNIPLCKTWEYLGWTHRSSKLTGKTDTQLWMEDDLHPYYSNSSHIQDNGWIDAVEILGTVYANFINQVPKINKSY